MILERNNSNLGYALCFLFSFLAMAVSYVLLSQVKEEAAAQTVSMDKHESILQSAVKILTTDKPFRSFVIVRFLVPFSTMASAFFTIYIIKQFNANERTVGLMASLLFFSTVIAGLILGWLSDHVGRKFAMLLSLAIITLTALFAFFARSLEIFYVIFILAGFIQGAFWSVFLSFSLEFGSETTRPTYVGLINTLIAPSTLIAQLFGGFLADTISYQTTFLIAGIFGVLTFLITFFFVDIPKQKATSASA